jgi:hypothetical protein
MRGHWHAWSLQYEATALGAAEEIAGCWDAADPRCGLDAHTFDLTPLQDVSGSQGVTIQEMWHNGNNTEAPHLGWDGHGS